MHTYMRTVHMYVCTYMCAKSTEAEQCLFLNTVNVTDMCVSLSTMIGDTYSCIHTLLLRLCMDAPFTSCTRAQCTYIRTYVCMCMHISSNYSSVATNAVSSLLIPDEICCILNFVVVFNSLSVLNHLLIA